VLIGTLPPSSPLVSRLASSLHALPPQRSSWWSFFGGSASAATAPPPPLAAAPSRRASSEARERRVRERVGRARLEASRRHSSVSAATSSDASAVEAGEAGKEEDQLDDASEDSIVLSPLRRLRGAIRAVAMATWLAEPTREGGDASAEGGDAGDGARQLSMPLLATGGSVEAAAAPAPLSPALLSPGAMLRRLGTSLSSLLAPAAPELYVPAAEDEPVVVDAAARRRREERDARRRRHEVQSVADDAAAAKAAAEAAANPARPPPAPRRASTVADLSGSALASLLEPEASRSSANEEAGDEGDAEPSLVGRRVVVAGEAGGAYADFRGCVGTALAMVGEGAYAIQLHWDPPSTISPVHPVEPRRATRRATRRNDPPRALQVHRSALRPLSAMTSHNASLQVVRCYAVAMPCCR
jgi:hypothetical protein